MESTRDRWRGRNVLRHDAIDAHLVHDVRRCPLERALALLTDRRGLERHRRIENAMLALSRGGESDLAARLRSPEYERVHLAARRCPANDSQIAARHLEMLH